MLRFIQDDGSHSSALESCLVDLAQFCRIIECGVFSSPFFLLPGRVIGIFSQLLEGDLVVFGAIERCAIRWPGFQQQERDRRKRVGMSWPSSRPRERGVSDHPCAMFQLEGRR